MAHDERGLGVAVGLLMEAFDGGHFPALLGPLEAIDDDHRAALYPHPATREESADALEPTSRESRNREGGRVEEVQQAMVAGIDQTEATNQAADPCEVRPQAQGS